MCASALLKVRWLWLACACVFFWHTHAFITLLSSRCSTRCQSSIPADMRSSLAPTFCCGSVHARLICNVSYGPQQGISCGVCHMSRALVYAQPQSSSLTRTRTAFLAMPARCCFPQSSARIEEMDEHFIDESMYERFEATLTEIAVGMVRLALRDFLAHAACPLARHLPHHHRPRSQHTRIECGSHALVAAHFLERKQCVWLLAHVRNVNILCVCQPDLMCVCVCVCVCVCARACSCLLPIHQQPRATHCTLCSPSTARTHVALLRVRAGAVVAEGSRDVVGAVTWMDTVNAVLGVVQGSVAGSNNTHRGRRTRRPGVHQRIYCD
jgi:hypothetical protein